MDVEENRLLCCIFFCKIAHNVECISFATSLADSYEFWLSRHCATYYAEDGTTIPSVLCLPAIPDGV
ncbi:hypothetical protein M3Y99_00490000 [Aphelenchoides fujianensis]|nr:hypothetical protein M3Y99_00490000 [Aphelenchoides fujianensis]